MFKVVLNVVLLYIHFIYGLSYGVDSNIYLIKERYTLNICRWSHKTWMSNDNC